MFFGLNKVKIILFSVHGFNGKKNYMRNIRKIEVHFQYVVLIVLYSFIRHRTC